MKRGLPYLYLLVLFSTVYFMAPAGKDEPPKPSHHVVYFYTCGELDGVLWIKDRRPRWIDTESVSIEELDQIRETEDAGNVSEVRTEYRGCSLTRT